jgi:hypothetical protein
MRTLLALVVSCLVTLPCLAQAQSAPGDLTWRQARVRPQDARLADLLRNGAARSATLRAIVNRLEAGNLFVYVSLSPNMRTGLAGKLTWMSKSGAFRYVRVMISPEQNTEQMIATLAHELQHAVEVSDEDSVIDQRSLIGLYTRIGRPSTSGVTGGFETLAAQEIGMRVRRELNASTASAFADGRVIDRSQS